MGRVSTLVLQTKNPEGPFRGQVPSPALITASWTNECAGMGREGPSAAEEMVPQPVL